MALVKCTYSPSSYQAATSSIVGALSNASYTPSRDVDILLNITDLTNGAMKKNPDKEYYWDGVAILDKLLYVLGQNLKTQLDNGWIEGSAYANAYVKMMEIATAQAIHFLEVQKELLLKDRQVDQSDSKNAADVEIANTRNKLEAAISDAKLKTEVALQNAKVASEVGLQNAKNALDACLQNNKLQLEEMKVNSDIKVANRQIAGYDDNLVIKLLQAELDAFALIYSSGMLDNPDLGPLNVTNLNKAWNMLISRV